jgi:hypothetical protein
MIQKPLLNFIKNLMSKTFLKNYQKIQEDFQQSATVYYNN